MCILLFKTLLPIVAAASPKTSLRVRSANGNSMPAMLFAA